MSYFALIPAAGSGSRMGGLAAGALPRSLPKQYLPLAGRPMIWHALAALCQVQAIEKIFVVLSPDDKDWPQAEMTALGIKLVVLRCGGATRATSVSNGLQAISEQVAAEDWVLVHDAARPCVTVAQIENLIAAIAADTNSVGGLLAMPLADTLKREERQATGRTYVAATVPREGLWQAQTPQMFRYVMLREALDIAPQVTDEASAIEALGLRPQLIESDATNLKVTYPADFNLAEMILLSRATL